MRTIFLFCLAMIAWQVRGETNQLTGTYAGVLPHNAKATIVFEATLGNFSEGPLYMRLSGEDVNTHVTTISFLVPAVLRRNGLITADFPFGGKFVGRFRPTRNAVQGHFYGFVRRDRPPISDRRFDMTPFSASPSGVFPGPNN